MQKLNECGLCLTDMDGNLEPQTGMEILSPRQGWKS